MQVAEGTELVRMPPFRLRVSIPPGGWPDDYGFSIEHPQPEGAIEALTANFRGFVVPKRETAPVPRDIVFMVAGTEAWRAPIELSRPDLARSEHAEGALRMGMACGFDTVLPSFLNPAGGPVVVAVDVAQAGPEPPRLVPLVSLAFDGGTPPTRHGGIGVLTINSMGRSGSSALCRLLSLHPKLYVPTLGGQYGEVFVAGHLSRTLAVLGSEGALSDANRVHESPDFVTLPSGYSGMDVQPDQREQKCRDEIQRASLDGAIQAAHRGLDALTSLALSRKPRAAWWVEKSWSSPSAPLLGALASRWREIVLVRSPEDFLRSQIAFHLKLGTPRAQLLQHLEATPLKFQKLYSSFRARRDFVHLVRYEDFVARPRDVIAGILDYLKLGASKRFLAQAETLMGKDDAFRRMISTASTPLIAPAAEFEVAATDSSSLGAWFVEMCHDFGYPVPARLDPRA